MTRTAALDARRAERERAARRARLRRRARATALVLAVAAPLGGLAWLVGASPVLAVDEVAVRGAVRVPADAVRAAAAVPVGTPLARVDADAVRARVQALRPVARVVVDRGWPGTLELRVVERAPVAAVLLPGGWWRLVDRGGVAFSDEPALPRGVLRLQVERLAPDDPATRAALAVAEELPAGLRARVRVVRGHSASAVSLGLRDGRTVVWGAPGGARVKAQAVEALLRLPGRVVDVSAPGVAVRR